MLGEDTEGVTSIAQAKKHVAPPSVVAAEPRLPWALATTQRLGRHAVAKRDIAPGMLIDEHACTPMP